ncbi:pyruvate dehydrogenase (acetyl-transferring) E1 component subunit alpha [Pseudolysinimonas sp.]|uniref:pyruvate dehydrogenase (acetyl-transferring) E1 component subunit alpha n=1 Tax=Pseudolysinimonas sp. TaxID=2680009 RepID=UPI003F7F2C2B
MARVPSELDETDIVQLLDPSGARRPSAAYDSLAADLTPDDLLALYRDMRVIRRIDDEATALQRQGELALWPPLRGQEATQLASARALGDGDFVFTSYREHGVAFARGVRGVDLVRVWRGATASAWHPYEHRVATPQVIIGAQSLHATGWAMGEVLAKGDQTPDAGVAYFGDGAMSEGDVAEAMVFAASFRLPVVFVCSNNQWAISEPVTLQAPGTLADRGPGFGIPSVRVDGNDVLAVYAVMREALDRARAGEGPTLIEAVTYRMGPHTTADDPTRYRTAEELAAWAERDPVDRLERLLRAEGILTDEREAEVGAAADEAGGELRAACIALPDPEPLAVFDHIYAEPNRQIERERAEYAAYLDGFRLDDATEARR